jgi:hypothetical protein
MNLWFHVTPLFLFPRILESGGVHCGADLARDNSPRRPSSQVHDNQDVSGLGERRCPANFVMLFRKRSSPLLRHKIEGTRKPGANWKARPHLRLGFSPEECLKLAGGRVFGSRENVGRTLANGAQPRILDLTSAQRAEAERVEEIMIPAAKLSLNALRQIVTFSTADRDLVRDHLRWAKMSPLVEQLQLEEKEKYAKGQTVPPGSNYLRKTREFYGAIWSNDVQRQTTLLEELAKECFD